MSPLTGRSLDMERGISNRPLSRRTGPINVLKYIRNGLNGVGDAYPVRTMPRIADTGDIGGIRKPLVLPTTFKIPNFPVANTQNSKDMMSAVRRELRIRRNAVKPIVKMPHTFNGLDVAQTPNVIAAKLPFMRPVFRGGIFGSVTGPKRSISMKYRQAVMPDSAVVYDVPDYPRIHAAPVPIASPPTVDVVNIDDVRNNSKLNFGTTTDKGDTNSVSPTFFLMGALVLAFLVLRK